MKPRHWFNASNAPGTCLWCGDRLRANSTERGLKRDLKDMRRLYSGEGLDRYIVERLQAHDRDVDRYGKHNGAFCTDRCAIEFATTAAARGYRFKPAEDETCLKPLNHNERPY